MTEDNDLAEQEQESGVLHFIPIPAAELPRCRPSSNKWGAGNVERRGFIMRAPCSQTDGRTNEQEQVEISSEQAQ